jgi:hypothetical protein
VPKINLVNFKELVMKATLNNSIETLQLNFDDNRIKSKMSSKNSQAITNLNIKNNVIDTDEYVIFNFSDPYTEVLPFIDLIESEEADIKIEEEKIRIISGPNKIDLRLSPESAVKIFTGDDVKIKTPQSVITEVNEDFMEGYEKAKRVAARFKKLYFNVNNNVLSMEASDMTNMFTNRFKYELMETKKMDDFTMCFDFRNFVNLMKVICLDPSNFEIGFLYVTEREQGMMQAIKSDKSEKYYLMSRNF